MRDVEDRLVKVETILETRLDEIVKGLEVLPLLKEDVKNNKEFRDSGVDQIIDNKLNSKQFDEATRKVIAEELKILLSSEETRTSFDGKVKGLIKGELKAVLLGVYIKISTIALTIASGVALAVIKGWF